MLPLSENMKTVVSVTRKGTQPAQCLEDAGCGACGLLSLGLKQLGQAFRVIAGELTGIKGGGQWNREQRGRPGDMGKRGK